MAWIALLRHGVTEWNQRGLIQGRTDTELSAAGAETLRQTHPADGFLRARWHASPLRRAAHTAALLNPDAPALSCAALIEANWGDFEGLHRSTLEARIHALVLMPNRGLDFTPPGGESARMVRRRLLPWLSATAAAHPAALAVTHKGVIRSVLSAACDWDMAADFNQKIDWTLPHIFRFDAGGKLRLARLNCPWNEPPAD